MRRRRFNTHDFVSRLTVGILEPNGALGKMLAELEKTGQRNSTLIVVGAKHGQSPNDVSTLHMEPGGNAYATKDVADPADVLSAAKISLAQETADSGTVTGRVRIDPQLKGKFAGELKRAGLR